MQERRTWIRWMGAIVTPLAIAGCGTSVLVPITDENEGQLETGTSGTGNQPGTSTTSPGNQIRDLTPAEAAAWCTKHVNGILSEASGLPVGSPDEVVPCGGAPTVYDGYIALSGPHHSTCGGMGCGSEPWLCMIFPTIDMCIQNLTLFPCEATVSELDTCVASMRGANGEPDFVCGGGCGPFRSHPNCGETVVHEFDYWAADGELCRLVVE